MSFNRKIMLRFILALALSMSIPGISIAASLENYLKNNLGPIGDVVLTVSSQNIMAADSSSSDQKSVTSRIDMGKAHMYLGYGTLICAGAAGVSGSDNAFHKGAGIAAAVMAIATCATGYAEYGDYFDMDEGLSPYNIHIVLGTVAAVGFAATAASAISSDDTGHAGVGVGSAVLATIPVIVVKW